MIYCFASFDNWQMETARCRARKGGKFLSIRTPLTFTMKQRRPHPVLPSAEVMCWLWAALQRLWGCMERQPALAGVPAPSSCVLEWPVLHGEALLEYGSSTPGTKCWKQLYSILKNYTGLSSAGEIPPNANFWDKEINGSSVPNTMTVENGWGDPKEWLSLGSLQKCLLFLTFHN